MAFRLFVDSSNGVSLDPLWNYKENLIKKESSHRTLASNYWVYKWSSYRKFKFGVEFISSGDMAIINSWHDTNTKLLFKNESSSSVYSVMLMGKDSPISKFVKPYDDEFKGTIDLETY